MSWPGKRISDFIFRYGAGAEATAIPAAFGVCGTLGARDKACRMCPLSLPLPPREMRSVRVNPH